MHFKQVPCLSTWLLLLTALTGCGTGERTQDSLPIIWEPATALNKALPHGVRVYTGNNDELPLRAWYVRIDEASSRITSRVVISDDPSDNRETVSSFAHGLGACVVVNGGYFRMDRTPADHVGLLVTDGRVVSPATRSVVRDSISYEIARAAIGFTEDGDIEITWATSRGDTVYAWADPPSHHPGQPAPRLDYGSARVWDVLDAVAAGPILIMNGQIKVATDQEVFFGTSIPDVHPRTAAGRTRDGDLLVMVVDGRQTISRGVSLEELAQLMLDVGAVEALNLDGGGSSTLVVNGVLLNRPAGGVFQREVMSALATFCE
jgi:hypothetical protein